jgi:hypothetical protein
MTKERVYNNVNWPQWLHRAWNKEKEDLGALFLDEKENQILMINTLERSYMFLKDYFVVLLLIQVDNILH